MLEDSVDYMCQQLILHFIELLDDLSFIEMLLYFLISCYVILYKWINQVLEDLPKPEEVVALSNHKLHAQIFGPFHVIERLEALLKLECHVLVYLQHL